MHGSQEQPYPDNMKVILPEPHLVAIGKVCAQWAQLESIMDLALWKFAGFNGDEPRGAMLTSHMAWPQRLDAFGAMAKHLSQEYHHLRRYPEVTVLLRKAQDGRNRIVHMRWGVDDAGEILAMRATARGELKLKMEKISVAEIEAVVDDIGKAAAALLKLVLNK